MASIQAANAQAPANDNFASAEVIPVATGTATGNNTNATVETGEPATHFTLTATGVTATANGTATGKSVWYSYTPTSNGLAYFSVLGKVVGTGPTSVAGVGLYAGVYTGSASDVASLTRVAAANSTAGAAATATVDATAGTKYISNHFQVTAGTTYYVQVTGAAAATVGPFDVAIVSAPRNGQVVLPPYSTWEWLHTLNGENPTSDALWNTKWKIPGDTTAFTVTGGTAAFNAAAPGPLGFAQLDGAPGIKSAVGTPTSVAAGNLVNNAAYFRRSFTLAADTSNLWAEILCDDGAYIYIDDFAGIPVNIAAKLTDTSTAALPVFNDFRNQTDALLTGAIPTTAQAAGTPVAGCRAYTPAGTVGGVTYNIERHSRMVFVGGLVGKLTAGTHRIAVSIHQTGANSSDDAFDLQLLDMTPRTLPTGGVGITFNDSPYVAQAANAVIAAEHHFAPAIGQTDLAWYCESPATRGATALNSAAVVSDANGGNQKALKLLKAETGRFVTEPLSVDGLPIFTAALKIMSRVTADTFEADDGFRVFLETSTDGINFSEPASPLNVQAQVNGTAALDPFKDVYTVRSLTVDNATLGAKAVRMVITGGVNSTTESIYFDDVRFSNCSIFATPTITSYNNQGDDDATNDTITFDLAVTGAGTTGPNWNTVGLLGGETTGALPTSTVTLTKAATNVTGIKTNLTFTVVDGGDATCTTAVVVVPPATTIGAITSTAAVRNFGADAAVPTDDTISFTVTVAAGTSNSVHYEVRSTDVGNTTLYATGTYGATATNVTVPAGVNSYVIVDKGTPATKSANQAINLAGVPIAMAKSNLNGTVSVIYNDVNATAPDFSAWRQGVALAADTAFTVDAYTAEMHPAAVITLGQVLQTPAISVAGLSNVTVTAKFRAFENSAGTGFETNDTFKIEVITEVAATPTTVNLIDGNAADKDLNKVLNGYTGSGTTTLTYDNNAGKDEFNLGTGAGPVLVAGNSAGTFNFTYNVPAGTEKVTVKLTGINDSANEYFWIQDIVIAGSSSNPNADSDGDGVTDGAEAIMGTNPNDPADVLRLTQNPTTPTNLSFPTKNGRFYRVYKSDDTDGQEPSHLQVWKDAGLATITGNGSAANFDIVVLPAELRRFYRLMVMTADGPWPATTP